MKEMGRARGQITHANGSVQVAGDLSGDLSKFLRVFLKKWGEWCGGLQVLRRRHRPETEATWRSLCAAHLIETVPAPRWIPCQCSKDADHFRLTTYFRHPGHARDSITRSDR